MDLDLNALLESIKDPAVGLPILGVLVLLNALLGVLVAVKQGDFTREYLLNFLRSRVLYQALPVGATGFGAIHLKMGLLTWFYITTAALMAVSLLADIKAKVPELFGSQQG